MKTIGCTKISFKKNNGEWHFLQRTNYYYEEPHETREISHTYEEFTTKDLGDIQDQFDKTKDSIFPWGKECLHWEDWGVASEWIYPGDTLTFKIEWQPAGDITFNRLMNVMRAEDFINYCKDKCVNININA